MSKLNAHYDNPESDWMWRCERIEDTRGTRKLILKNWFILNLRIGYTHDPFIDKLKDFQFDGLYLWLDGTKIAFSDKDDYVKAILILD